MKMVYAIVLLMVSLCGSPVNAEGGVTLRLDKAHGFGHTDTIVVPAGSYPLVGRRGNAELYDADGHVLVVYWYQKVPFLCIDGANHKKCGYSRLVSRDVDQQ